MSDKNNNELTVTEGFAVLANQDVLNEASGMRLLPLSRQF